LTASERIASFLKARKTVKNIKHFNQSIITDKMNLNPLINYTSLGLANTVINPEGKIKINLNRNLLKYPDLYHHYLKHELQHTKDKGVNERVTFNDVRIDLYAGFNPFVLIKTLSFMIKHPLTLFEFSPIRINDGRVGIAPLLLICWLLTVIILLRHL